VAASRLQAIGPDAALRAIRRERKRGHVTATLITTASVLVAATNRDERSTNVGLALLAAFIVLDLVVLAIVIAAAPRRGRHDRDTE